MLKLSSVCGCLLMQQQITFEPIGGVIEVLLIFTLLSNFTINITCKMW